MMETTDMTSAPDFRHSGIPAPKSADALRIVQVETFYQPYLDVFYGARPELVDAPHARQIAALIADGFSALHNIAPYLETLGYDAHFIVGNGANAQRAWLRDHGVAFPAGTRVGFAEALRAQIDALDPDILYFSDATAFGADFVRSLRRRPRLVVAWHAAPILPGTDWSEVDLFLSGLAAMRDMARLLGARTAERYMPGAPEWLPAGRGLADENVDLLFTGSYTPVQHARRNRCLEAISRYADETGASCALHMATPAAALPPALAARRRDPVFGVDMQRMLATGRVVFDARSDMTAIGPDGAVHDVAGRETANMRLFEATSAGAFLLTERWDNLGDYFEAGREIETFAGEGELLEKAAWYLARPEARRAIADAGMRRCREEHGMRRRAPFFDGLIRRLLPKRAVMSVAAPSVAPVPPVRHFCTYFDGAYAVRGLAMIASVRRFLPDARFVVLCLDETAQRIVHDRCAGVRVVTPEELEAFDPELAESRKNRSKYEFYFTCTPCLPRYAFHLFPDAASMTYLDADLFFYRSPEEVFARIGAASVAITPHRFTPKLAPGRIVYGRYNVGWVTWASDSEGRRCLDDYRADCLAWCHDRLEGDRFADQKYLDQWPQRYRNVCELDGKGINLALWNVDDCTLSQRDGTIYADDEPLVFVHFHGVKHIGPTSWDLRFSEYGVTGNHPFLTEAVYRPYLSLLQQAFDRLAPVYGLTAPGDPRFTAKKPPEEPAAAQPRPAAAGAGVLRYYKVDRATAAALNAADGWAFEDVAATQDAVYAPLIAGLQAGKPRRDFVVAAQAVAVTGLSRPTLLEIGCGSGYYRHVFDALCPGGVDYVGVDKSAAMIGLARRKHPDLKFHEADATHLPFPDGAADIVFNGAALMHIINYEDVIAEARRVTRGWCVFHTTPLLRKRPTMFLVKDAYGRQVAEVLIGEGELRMLLAMRGLTVRRVLDSIPYPVLESLGEDRPTVTIVCEATGPREPGPALLNVACGDVRLDGWVNIDRAPKGDDVMVCDPAAELPFPDNAFDLIRCAPDNGAGPWPVPPSFPAECLRILKPGGTLRIGVPDAESAARAYLGALDAGDGEYAAAAAALAQAVGDRTGLSDRRSLGDLLSRSGFGDIRRVGAGESAFAGYAAHDADAYAAHDADAAVSNAGRIFMEARKPQP